MSRKIVLVFCFFIFGCFSTPDSNFYMINSQPSKAVSLKKSTISIYNISFPEYIDKPQIVLQDPYSAEIKISEFNRWGTDLPTMFQRVLIDNLQSMLPNFSITPLLYGFTPQYIVKIEVKNFSGWLNGGAILKAKWQIVNFAGKIIYSKVSLYKSDVKKNYASYVAAQSSNLAQLSEDIANILKNI